MPRIDFYFIPQMGFQACLLFACRLLEKAYLQQANPIYVHCENAEKARFFDQLLWTYRDDSFIPHHLYEEKPECESPIQIGYTLNPKIKADILLNLHPELPTSHDRFQRILEIIPKEAATLARAEERRAFYEKQGYTIHSHQLTK
jgi:DNA polymerase-3 subunit chi